MTWDDDDAKVTASILDMVKRTDVVICTSGMSVDPMTRLPLPSATQRARVVSIRAPVLPGAMFLLAYLDVADGDEKAHRRHHGASWLCDVCKAHHI